MAPENKKRRPILVAFMFLLALGAIFLFAASFLFGPRSGDIIKGTFSDKRVAIIRLEGVILDSARIIKQLEKWADDDSVKAIVMRINSPGGVVTPSQEIFNEVRRTTRKKPVIASMGALAASGGYYVAAGCDRIVASSGTLTGSIGVIMMFSNSEKLMDWIGIKTNVIKSGKFKDAGSPHRPLTEADRAVMQGIVDDTYEQFIEDISSSRGMDIEEVRKVADGRIYTGRQAKALNLVDDIGDLKEAIDIAAKTAGIVGEPDIAEDIEAQPLLRRLLGEDFDTYFNNKFFLMTGIYYIWPSW
ncbi:hypothetical protein MNBD_NITROSPINAE02-315 [hydrothermal vent metagenome]|uniref:Peptidase S49 domain-containing protein n=1 Tax=hydrothermal vent metagenome TaxID=652676 RepID=A0A3B1BJD1_9ZZZZ